MKALAGGAALLMLAALGSLMASPSTASSLIPAGQILVGGSLVLLATQVELGPRAARALTTIILIAAWGLLVLSLVGTDWPTYKLPWLSGLYGLLPTLRTIPFPGIADGFQPNQIGGLVAVAFAFFAGVTLLGSRGAWPGPALWYGSAGLAGLALPTVVLTGSRAGLAGAGIALFVLLCLLIPRLVFVPAAALIAAPLAAIVWSDFPGRVAALFLRDETLDTKLVARLDIWLSALRGIEDHAMTGIGLGVFNDVIPLRYPYESVGLSYSVSQAHNVFLDTALTMGLPALFGLLLLLAGLVVLGRHGLQHYDHRRPLSAAALAATTTYLVFGMTDGLSFSSPGSLTLWAVAAVLALLSSSRKRGVRTGPDFSSMPPSST